MPKKEPVHWEEKFLDKIEKQFPDDNIIIIYIFIGPWGAGTKRKQSLLVNGNKIGFSWSPPLDKIETEETYNMIYDMCIKEIENEKNK